MMDGTAERNAEPVAQKCSVKKVFLKSSQNSWKNTCARVSFLIILRNFNTFYDTTPLVAASGNVLYLHLIEYMNI